MLRMTDHQIGVCQSERVLFSEFVDGGPMWTGEGARENRTGIEFDRVFSAPPLVHLSMTMWDAHSNSNQRMDLLAENITTTSFELVFRTWSDSRVARIRASWMAIGTLPHEDDWEL